jgi:3-methyladenine DNA glycosylase AlkD
MTVQEILSQLEALGSESTRKVLGKHGLPEGSFGVKVGDLKPLQKKLKKNHALSMELYRTGNSDAMYLAGLIADEKTISKAELQEWAVKATWYMISEYTVAWVAAESAHGWELGLEWIDSGEEKIAAAGWSTLASWVSIRPDEELDLAQLSALLDRVGKELDSAPNRVRYVMNGFVIAVGSYVPDLTDRAMAIGQGLGKVKVDMGGTACKVPSAPEYIQKVVGMGRVGKKRKEARC